VKSARAKAFEVYGIPLLLIVAGVTIVPSSLNMFREIPGDFLVFLRSSSDLRRRIDPYQHLLTLRAPNTNPPAFLIAMLPLTYMSEGLAFAVWTMLAVAALIFSLQKTAEELSLPLRHLLLVASGLQGVAAALRFGQVTLLVLPLMTLAWVADRNERKPLTGVYLGLLMYLKPFAGIYAVYMAWRRDWRVLIASIAAFFLAAAIGLVTGIATTASWIESLGSAAEKSRYVTNGSWTALMMRVFSQDQSRPNPSYTPWIVAPRAAVFLSIAGAVLIAIISAWSIGRIKNRDRHWSILGVAMLLISPLGWMYYIPLLIPPLAATMPTLQRIAPILVAGAILWVPSNLLARNHFGPLATATIGSPYTWGLLLLWATVCLCSRRNEPATAE